LKVHELFCCHDSPLKAIELLDLKGLRAGLDTG
jgi:hypothetical protein